MSESQAGDTSLIDPKVKNSLLDGDIGQDLFSSWKSASATEDEDMDFNFETETKGKKKAFSFDKLDMDFNIGGGFDNISIFKMGMPDLDFSSPSEKNAKPGEKMKEKSVSGDGPGKKEHFTFSFDFNKLEDFDFRSSLEKEDKKSNKNLNLKDVLDKSKCYGSGNHKVQNVGALDGSRGHEPPTIIPPETSSKFSNLVASGGQGTHLAKEVTSSADAKGMKGYQTDKTNLTEPCPQLAIGNIVSEVQTESYIQDAIVSSSSGDDKHVNLDIVTAKENNEKNSQQQSTKSSPVNIDMLRTNADQNIDSVRDNHVPVETIQSTSPAQACADLTTTSTIRDLRKSPHPISKLTCPPSSSELRIEKLNSREDKETGVIRTKFSKTSEEAEFRLHQASSGSKIDNIIHHTLGNERREGPADAQTVGKLTNNSKSSAGKLPKSILVFPADKAKDLSDARDEFKAAQKLTKGKLLSDTRKHHKEASNLENASLVSEKDDNDLNRMSPCRSTVQTTVSVGEKRSKFLDSRKVPHQQSLGSSPKAVERTLDISTFKISRTQGVKNNLSHTKLHTDVKSLRNRKEIDVHGNAASKTVPARVVVADKQILSNPSLKRKTYEASNADLVALNSRKRLLESPRESRHGDQPENGVAEQACDRYDLFVESNFKTACHDGSASTIVPQEVNLKEKEIHSLVENDGNVDKAEAYTKDLENICNTLKRKHEEAKELLVRAIVSNNYLLMLNHPIFEDKIGRVQKFAARLMSGKTQNCSV